MSYHLHKILIFFISLASALSRLLPVFSAVTYGINSTPGEERRWARHSDYYSQFLEKQTIFNTRNKINIRNFRYSQRWRKLFWSAGVLRFVMDLRDLGVLKERSPSIFTGEKSCRSVRWDTTPSKLVVTRPFETSRSIHLFSQYSTSEFQNTQNTFP